MPNKAFLQSNPSSLIQKLTMAFTTLNTLTTDVLPSLLFDNHCLDAAASAEL